MKVQNLLALTLILAVSLAFSDFAGAAAKPQPRTITGRMGCGVCGMYPARNPEWQTQIIFKDGVMVPFDGPKDMFRYLLNMTAYNHKETRDEVAAVWVRDHASGSWTDGETAFYVVGSSAKGPMGAELVPFGNATAAKDFQAKNGGTSSAFARLPRNTRPISVRVGCRWINP